MLYLLGVADENDDFGCQLYQIGIERRVVVEVQGVVLDAIGVETAVVLSLMDQTLISAPLSTHHAGLLTAIMKMLATIIRILRGNSRL